MRYATAIVVAWACFGATAAQGQQAPNDPAAITPVAGARRPAETAPADTVAPDPAVVVAEIFKASCRRCHGSDRPAIALSLKADTFADAMIDVPSREIKELMLVDTSEPEKSYLLMKLRGDEGIIGEVMPIGGKPLDASAIAAVETWVRTVSAAADTASAEQEPEPEDAAETEEAPGPPETEEAPEAEEPPRAPPPAQGS